MKKIRCLLLFMLLILRQPALAGPIQTDCFQEPPGTLSQDNSLLTRVIKYAKIHYPLAIVPNQVWTQMPDMAVLIDLPFPQAVMIRYSIQILTPAAGWMITRLMIDGVQDDNYRLMTGYTHHHSNFVLDFTWLSKGVHQIKVQYRTSNAHPSIDMNNDYNAANFKVQYYIK